MPTTMGTGPRRRGVADAAFLAPADHPVAAGQSERRSPGEHHGIHPVDAPAGLQERPFPGPRRRATDLPGGCRGRRQQNDRATRPGHLVRPVADPYSRNGGDHLFRASAGQVDPRHPPADAADHLVGDGARARRPVPGGDALARLRPEQHHLVADCARTTPARSRPGSDPW